MRSLFALALAASLAAGAAFGQAPARELAVDDLLGSTSQELAARLGGAPVQGAKVPVDSAEATPAGVLTVVSGVELNWLSSRCDGRLTLVHGVGQDGQLGSLSYEFLNDRLVHVRLGGGGEAVRLVDRGCGQRPTPPSVAEQALFALIFSPVIVPTAISRGIKHVGDEGRREAINAALGELKLGAEPEGGVDAWAARHVDVAKPVGEAVAGRREFVLSVRPGEAVRSARLPASGAHVAFQDGKAQRFWVFNFGVAGEFRTCVYEDRFVCA